MQLPNNDQNRTIMIGDDCVCVALISIKIKIQRESILWNEKENQKKKTKKNKK